MTDCTLGDQTQLPCNTLLSHTTIFIWEDCLYTSWPSLTTLFSLRISLTGQCHGKRHWSVPLLPIDGNDTLQKKFPSFAKKILPLLFRHASNPLDSFVLVRDQHCQAESPTFDTCLREIFTFRMPVLPI